MISNSANKSKKNASKRDKDVSVKNPIKRRRTKIPIVVHKEEAEKELNS